MFNNKDKNKVNGTSPQSPSLNMISEGTTLKGTINSQNDIRVAGRVNGEAISKGKLILTSSGVVEGNVKSAEADIAGKVEGELRVSSKLILRKSAVIDGDIYTKTLVVEEGAQMNGACRMGSETENLKASTDSDFEKATTLKTDGKSEEKSADKKK
ncbi:MAG: polymer-forming cytoskeletal protein [Balneolaceae bacterium]